MKSVFTTTDVDLAAYLYARSYSLLHVATVEGTTCFTFPSEAALSAEAFYFGATVAAKTVLDAARELDHIGRKGRNVHYTA